MKLRKLNNGYYSLYDSDGDIVASNNPNTPCSKRLSKQNCDEIFGVTDVNELANQNAKKDLFNGGYDGLINAHQQMLIEVSYINGFKKAMELNKDKLFGVKEVVELCKILLSNPFEKCGKTYQELTDNYIQSLQQPKEIKVEIEMETKKQLINGYKNQPDNIIGFISEYKEVRVPKLNENGCIILIKK
jgi:hypothetical protein